MQDGFVSASMYASTPSIKKNISHPERDARFIIKISVRSLDEAFTALYRMQRVNKEVLPNVATSEKVQYKNYYPLILEGEMFAEDIDILLEKRGLEHADIILFLAVQEEVVEMGDENPAVVFWKNGNDFYHCLCALEKKTGIRFVEVDRAWKKYPPGTTVLCITELS